MARAQPPLKVCQVLKRMCNVDASQVWCMQGWARSATCSMQVEPTPVLSDVIIMSLAGSCMQCLAHVLLEPAHMARLACMHSSTA